MNVTRSVPSAATPNVEFRLSGPSAEMTVDRLQDSPPSRESTNTSRPCCPEWKSASRVTTPKRPPGSFWMTGQ